MKLGKLMMATVIVAGAMVACETESNHKYVDVNGDGVADIEYTKDGEVIDLHEDDMITVEGTTVVNSETNEEWDIVDEQALENSFDNIEANLENFANDAEEGAKKVGNDIEEGAKKVGQDIEEGAQKAGEAIEDGAHEVGEGIEKVGEDIQNSTDDHEGHDH